MYITFNKVSKRINEKVILKEASFTIEENEKIALVGINGTGKTTLLKMLARLDPYDSGQSIYKSGIKIHYLQQHPTFLCTTVWEEMMALNKTNEHPVEEFEIKSTLTRLGIHDFDKEIITMSGGQQKRLALARALLSECDVLLLDEPTNHLDNSMVDWLENYLIRLKSSVLMVTHDRYFLNRVCSRIFEMDQGDFYIHDGNYEKYLENKQIREELEQEAAKKHKNLYLKELAWVRAGCQARSTKQQSRLQRFEELRNTRFKQKNEALHIDSTSKRLGKKTIEWNNLSFGYEDILFKDFSYSLLRNDRIGIIGPNGCGKSTLLNIIAGKLQPDTGSIEYGSTISIGYFEQKDLLDLKDIRVIDYIEKDTKVIEANQERISASIMLERFLFPKSLQYTMIDRLSGGERKRLYLCKILIERPNVLILDEPTNDLDTLTLEVLEDYLDSFDGIVMVVSHDRYFLDRVCDKVFVYQPDKTLKPYHGGYSEYLQQYEDEKESHSKSTKTTWKTKPTNTLTYMEKRELESLNQQMEELEIEIDEINEKMSVNLPYEQMKELDDLRTEKESLLEEITLRWMELEEKKEM
ncbi:MAG: ABC-F family ATP-binding cassette domain-containing protein [Holdemanella sp.]|nr:ABC-F family ATP-binding cassette domain-containing protein [Holdemanella sp.]